MKELLNTKKPALISVGLPVFNSRKIVWLAMEGLCNQKKPPAWELVICEEVHKYQTGVAFFNGYVKKLQKAGCVRVLYIELPKWVPLPKKWRCIGRYIDPASKVFLLHAADCYSFSTRLADSYKKVAVEGYDWFDTLGYFYSFKTKKLYIYHKEHMTNLNMSFKSEFARNIPASSKRKSVDGFLYRYMANRTKGFRRFTDTTIHQDGIDTHGYNNISIKRPMTNGKKFTTVNTKFEQTTIPAYVIQKIRTL